MFSTFVVCAATLCCAADPAVPSQPAASQPASQAKTAPAAEVQHIDPQPSPAATTAEKKPESPVRPSDHPQANASKTETKPETKTTPKLELLAIEKSIIDYTNAERVRFGLPALVADANLMATARQHCTWMTTYRQLVHTNIGVAEEHRHGPADQPGRSALLDEFFGASGKYPERWPPPHRCCGIPHPRRNHFLVPAVHAVSRPNNGNVAFEARRPAAESAFSAYLVYSRLTDRTALRSTEFIPFYSKKGKATE